MYVEIPIKASLPLAWEPPRNRYMRVILNLVHFSIFSISELLTERCFVFSASHITETETSLLKQNSPSPAALKIVILTTSSAVNDENLIQWWKSNQNNETSVSVSILLDIYITHRCPLLMAYITVLGWSSEHETYSNIILRRTRICRYYGLLFFGECTAVCHLPRQEVEFAACCLRILFSLCLFFLLSYIVAMMNTPFNFDVAFLNPVNPSSLK